MGLHHHLHFRCTHSSCHPIFPVDRCVILHACIYLHLVYIVCSIYTCMCLLCAGIYVSNNWYMQMMGPVDMKKKYKAKWALVTGAGTGIGKNIPYSSTCIIIAHLCMCIHFWRTRFFITLLTPRRKEHCWNNGCPRIKCSISFSPR